MIQILAEVLQMVLLISQIIQKGQGSPKALEILSEVQALGRNIQAAIDKLPPNGQLTQQQISDIQDQRHAAVKKWDAYAASLS